MRVRIQVASFKASVAWFGEKLSDLGKEIWRRKQFNEIFRLPKLTRPLGKEVLKQALILLKCALILLIPIVPAWIADEIWGNVFVRCNMTLSEKAESIISAGVIPTLGILYIIFETMITSSVWKEYKLIRLAIKTGD